jgi:hypothetical protein
MTKIDQFESVFRSADKPVFTYRRVEFERVLVVVDLEESEANAFLERVRKFLAVLGDGPEWSLLGAERSRSVERLLEAVEESKPDLICTYRNLHSRAWSRPHSLGAHLDVLTQAGTRPVLVLPHPRAERALEHALENTDVVMAMTSHLAGDASLVNFGVRFTEENGTIWLSHVEDQAAFDRVINAISRIPSIDTADAREQLLDQLLKEAEDYIHSCRQVLSQEGLAISVEKAVTLGHRLREYKRLVEGHEVDLLVMHTKDEDQLAMHGLAYPLAVELREIPLLML